MGNQISSPNDELGKKRVPNFLNDKKEGSGIIIRDSLSSYKGVKTETCSDGSNVIMKDTTESSTIINNGEKNEVKDNKVQTIFEWKEGGNSVYVTGTFSNWNQWFLMNRINNNFEITLVSKIFIVTK
jgi:hypothetical protein